MKILITGSDGLIGGEAVQYFDKDDNQIIGADNNSGGNLYNRGRIYHKAKRYKPTDYDMMLEGDVWSLFETEGPFDVIIYCADSGFENFLKEMKRRNSVSTVVWITGSDSPSITDNNTTTLKIINATGPGQSEKSEFGLNRLIRCAINGTEYSVSDRDSQQDFIHSVDVVSAISEIIKNPKQKDYIIGGGFENYISQNDAIEKAEQITGRKMNVKLTGGPQQSGVCQSKQFKSDYPNWRVEKSINDIFNDTFKRYYWGQYSDHTDTRTGYGLNQDSLVFDVGGYRGAWTASIIELYNPIVQIFEPVTEFYNDCVRRFRNNPSVTVNNFGFFDRDCKLEIAKQGVNSSVFRGGDSQESLGVDPIFGLAKPEIINLIDISQYLRDNKVEKVDLVSFNCEGGEYEILNRLIETGQIKIFDNVQVQFHDFHANAVELREHIRAQLKFTHTERFNYPFVWESWKRK